MLDAASADVISSYNTVKKLQNAYQTMLLKNNLLKNQIEAITAAAKQKAELH